VATFEKTGTVAAQMSASGFATVAAAATAMIGVGLPMMVQLPGPEPGYHLVHDHHDLVGGGLMVGVGFAALYATLRAIRPRDVL
jgi:hypothetical protein